MASKTRHRKTRERLKIKKQGRDRKKRMGKASTPPFPIHHPERHAGLGRGTKGADSTEG